MMMNKANMMFCSLAITITEVTFARDNAGKTYP